MIYEDEERNQEEFKKPEHITYKEYKKKLEKNPNESLILFVSAFFAMVILFLGIAKQLSPDVDVSIADNSEETTVDEDNEAGNVDERLRLLQMEDNSYAADDTFSPELEEKVQLPTKKRKTVGEHEAENQMAEKQQAEQTKSLTQEAPKPAISTTPAVPQQPVNAKVIVGYYATQQQAEVAKGIIQDAGLNIQPFVKNIGGAYTLQVGSFTSKEKAQGVANELLKNNFPARVIVE